MTTKNILNLDNMKHTNRMLVLDMLLRNGAMSRVDITRELKCDGTTITHIIRDLSRQGLVRSAGMAEPSGGRPKELIALDPDSRQAIGISFEPPYVTGIITGLTGKINFCEKIYLSVDISSGELVDIIKKLTGNLISRTERKKLLGIGLTTFGLLSPEENKVINSNYFPAIKDIPFIDIFMKEFDLVPSIIDNAYAKAIAEINFSETVRSGEMRNFILLDIGVGLVLLNICRGVPVLGSGGYVGEFGHIIINPEGKKCYCGRKGCLETQCSIPAIEREVSAVLKNISFDKIVSLYKQGEKRVEKIVNNSAMILGNVTGNMLTVLPTDEIIFTGRLLEFGDKYLAVLEEGIRKTAFPLFMKKTRMLKSRNPEENAALGACSIILNSFFEGNSPDLKDSRQS